MIVCTQKRALPAASDDDSFHLLLDFTNHARNRLACVVTIRINEARLAQHVDGITLHNQVALAAGAALVALVGQLGFAMMFLSHGLLLGS
jgi:hypothetical protein